MSIEIDVSEARAFFDAMEAAAKGGFRKEMEAFLEGLGVDFLRIVEDEIVRRDVTDSRLLVDSFHKGNKNNVWDISDGGLTLEVGTVLDYASYVNEGHWTNKKGVAVRFVPGYWNGDHFEHDTNAKGGMVLKQQWVSGKPYWDSARRILERIMPEALDRKIQEWLDNYFG